MRITFVLPYAGLQGGIRVLAIYAQRLKDRGHTVTVVSAPEVIRLRRIAKSLLLGRGLPQREPSHFASTDVDHRVLGRPRPVTDEDVPDADVVVATYYTTARGVMQLSRSKGAKAIFIQNYEAVDGVAPPALDESWRLPMHKITISQWLVALARDKFGDDIVSHVPNSVDTKLFYAPIRAQQSRPTVGLLYNAFALKGLPTSLEALRLVANELPALKVLSFGAEHPDRRWPLPRDAEFAFRPSQAILRRIYGGCDVWLCGSNVEGFHLPPVEAMACRCPVVSTRVGGPVDIIEEGRNGYLVDVGDPRALADRALQVLRASPDTWEALSRGAYETATRFTWDDATDRFERALELAIARRTRGDF